MIDYIKISLRNIDVNRLINLPQLEFKTEVSEKTGELSKKKIAEYHFCKIIVHNDKIVLFQGSIHKLWNSLNEIYAPNYSLIKNYTGFNGNQFTLNNIFEIRVHLMLLFDCQSEQMIFQNIEVGINSTPVFAPNLYIKGLLYHRNRSFEFRFHNSFAQVVHQRYMLKIYNKSYQYGMSKNSLRVEIKIMKMMEINSIGIETFADVDALTLDKSKGLLLKRFDEVLHYDYTIDKKKLTDHQKMKLKDYSNPRYWLEELQPNHRFRHKKNLRIIIEEYSQSLHSKIREDIVQKCSIINHPSISVYVA